MEKMKLNPKQQAAVAYDKGPLLILAGAGTGKTTVITERIKWLIKDKKVRPEQILALTFTEKAAYEMEERVDMALPLGYNRTWILTFHGFCERILRQEAVQIGLDPNFTILSEAETLLFLKEHLFEFDLSYYRPQGNPTKFLGGLTTHISRLKDEAITVPDYQKWVEKIKKENRLPQEEINKYQELAEAYTLYEKLKVKNSVMDFADLISNTLLLFRKRPNILSEYQRKFPYILIDEFQDTNYAQNHLAIMLAGKNQQITAVADDDQSIYRWRGAAVYNVLDFQKHFPKAEIITLTDNYRCDQKILDVAYQAITHNNPDRLEVKAHVDKKLLSRVQYDPKDATGVSVIWEETVEDEAERVIEQIEKIKPGSYNEIAILVRANNHAEPFMRALARNGIPYQFLGPGKLFRQAEIKELIAYLKLLDNPIDNLSMYKVLEMPLFSLSGRDIVVLVAAARQENISIFEVLERVVAGLESAPTLGEQAEASVQAFMEMLNRHLDRVGKSTPGEILYYFLEDTGELKRMRDPQSEGEVARIENISAFFNRIKAYETQHPESMLHEFIEYLDFLIQAGESPVASEVDWTSGDAVNILTVHSAKGLEFPYVFIANLVDLRFPTTNRKDQIPLPEDLIKEPEPVNDPHVAEERRLFYVALTRGKKRVYLTGSKFYHDAKRPKKLSPFVMEALGDNLDPFRVGAKGQADRLFEIESLKPEEAKAVSTKAIEPTPITYLSYSQIETFKTCPMHYKIEYLLKIPRLPGAALTFGTSVHDTLSQVYSLIMRGELPREYNPVWEQAEKLYQEIWSPLGYESKAHEKKYFEQGKEIIAQFLHDDLPKDTTIVALEEPFTFHIDERLRVGGRIDRIDQHPDGSFEVIDYKTGQVPSDCDLKSGLKGLQLSIYALAVTHPQLRKLPLDQVTFSFHYLEKGERKTLDKSIEDLQKAKEEILKTKEEIEMSDFSCNHGYFCQNACDYQLFCD